MLHHQFNPLNFRRTIGCTSFLPTKEHRMCINPSISQEEYCLFCLMKAWIESVTGSDVTRGEWKSSGMAWYEHVFLNALNGDTQYSENILDI